MYCGYMGTLPVDNFTALIWNIASVKFYKNQQQRHGAYFVCGQFNNALTGTVIIVLMLAGFRSTIQPDMNSRTLSYEAH